MNAISKLLESVSHGETSIEEAERQLRAQGIHAIDGATIDFGRAHRCGFGEVIYGEGKPAELISNIIGPLLQNIPEVLVTRLDEQAYEKLRAAKWQVRYNPTSRTLRVADRHTPVPPGDLPSSPLLPVAVVSAGSTDEPVAQEAAETLAWMQVPVRRLTDIGVAGPQRLLGQLDQLRGCSTAIVVAGMEGALPSVVAGHVPYPVIAVPTSIGYGASLSGITPLLAMLSSCASNVAVVNIDAGFKGGYVAGLIATGVPDNSQGT